MARTKQTARCSTGGKAPRKILASQAKRKSLGNSQIQKIEEEIKEENNEKPQISLNNFAIKFDDQKQCEDNSIEAPFIRCFSCHAILNSQSELLDKTNYLRVFQKNQSELNDAQNQQILVLAENDRVWLCEFCDFHNKIPSIFQVPAHENPCYLIGKSIKDKENDELDGNTVIFCIDLSGSMDQTVCKVPSLIKGKQKYLSRKDCVITALLSQLERMKNAENPCFVGLVTFSEKVCLIGDGSQKEITYTDKNLNNYDHILEQTQNHYKSLMKRNVNENFNILKEKLNNLDTSGSTALGPGLLSAVSLASKGKPGSKVIICTDGLANVGLGSLENYNSEKESKKFYEKVGLYAKSKGISISVITIKADAECNIQILSKVALETDGVVSRVDPEKISSDFKFILEDEVLGTNAKLILRLNRAYKFINEDKKFLKENGCLYEKDIGNFGVSTEFTMEFEVKTQEELKSDYIKSLNLLKKKKLPIQMELCYRSTRTNNKYLQIFTDWRENREQKPDEEIDLDVLTRTHKQKWGKMVHKGDFDQAEKLNKNLESLISANTLKDGELSKKLTKNLEKMKTLVSKKKAKKVNTQVKRKSLRNKGKNKSKSPSRSRSRSQERFSDSDEEMVYKTMKYRKSRSRSRSK